MHLEMEVIPTNGEEDRQDVNVQQKISKDSPSFDTEESSCSSHARAFPPSPLSSCLAPKQQRRRRRRRNVSFGDVSIRQHNICLGDHPLVSNGPPLSLDWYYDEETNIDIDEYESDRQLYNQRRSLAQMKIGPDKRRSILLRRGHSNDEITQRIKEVQAIQKQRKKTVAFLPALPTGSSRRLEAAAKKFVSAVDKATTIRMPVAHIEESVRRMTLATEEQRRQQEIFFYNLSGNPKSAYADISL